MIATPLWADCTADVRALFDEGGAMNAVSRPPHSQMLTNYNPDSSVMSAIEARVASPVRSITHVVGDASCALSVEAGYWMGTCWDGPWDGMSGEFPPGRADKLRATIAQLQASVSEAECFGAVELEGRSLTKYRYRVLSGKAEDYTLGGGLYTVFVGSEGQVVRWEVDDVINAWKPEPDGERSVMEITYEPVTITAPGE